MTITDEARKALRCLYIAVDESVADSVNAILLPALDVVDAAEEVVAVWQDKKPGRIGDLIDQQDDALAAFKGGGSSLRPEEFSAIRGTGEPINKER